MADKRRRRWIAVDIDYYAGPLADEIRERFGPVGLLVFDAYLRACKKHMIEGRVTYSCEPEFLSIIGLPGMGLVDESGDEWSLDALWSLLADHKQISRRHRGRLTDVISSRWEQWQKQAIRKPPVGENGRSGGINVDAVPNESDAEICSDLDVDLDRDMTGEELAPPQADDAPSGRVSTKTSGKAKRGTRLPEPFDVTDGMKAWATEKFPDVDINEATEAFCDFHAGKGSVQADWERTWHTWIRNTRRFSPRGSSRPVNGVTAAKAWDRVHAALQRGQRPKFDDHTEGVISALGGWQQLRVSTNQVADRAHFIKFYEGI